MAFDRGLEERLCEYFQERQNLLVKKMFGGLCFLLSGHMCCAIVGDKLMARIGPKKHKDCLAKPHPTEKDFTGTPIKTMVYVNPDGFEPDSDLSYWLNICVTFLDSLPSK